VCRVSGTLPSQPFDKESGDCQAVSKQQAKLSVSLRYASGSKIVCAHEFENYRFAMAAATFLV